MLKRLWPHFPPGLRMQLTLCYTLVSAVLLLVFGVTLYTSLQQSLASSFDTTLRMRAQQVAEGITIDNGRLLARNILHELPELDATAALTIDPFEEQMQDDDDLDGKSEPVLAPSNTAPPTFDKSILIRVLDAQKRLVYYTPAFDGLVLPDQSFDEPLHGRPWYGTLNDLNGQPLRLYSTMLVDRSHVIGIIQIGQTLDNLNSKLQNILVGLLVVTPFVLILSAIGSYWLAERAFKPIHRLAYTAREISATDLHQRVPVPVPKDEVQDLSIIFNQMIMRLERAFTQQRRFVADASHELRTPVAVIRSMTEVALSNPSTLDDYEMVLREINAESERLGKLISDLLALARADEGQVQFDNEPVRFDLLVADVLASLEPLAIERQVSLHSHMLQSATVVGDAARLIQVIISLVDNALNYTNSGGEVTVSVKTCRSHLHLLVEDTGIGISAEDLEHIFERFYRADPARSKAIGGTGLGLSIVDWVVRIHRGTTTVESQPGHGSRFLVTLPLAPSGIVVSSIEPALQQH